MNRVIKLTLLRLQSKTFKFINFCKIVGIQIGSINLIPKGLASKFNFVSLCIYIGGLWFLGIMLEGAVLKLRFLLVSGLNHRYQRIKPFLELCFNVILDQKL